MTEQTKNTKGDASIEQDIDVSTEECNNKETDSLINQSIPCDSFDWDEIINLKSGSYSLLSYPEEERSKYEEIYYNSFNLLKSNQIVTGNIVLINDREVVINVGYKSDGLVSLSEFRDMPDLKVGNEVEVLVEKPEDKNGQLILSRKKAKIHYAWEEINKALEEDRIIIGKVKSRTKGGLIVDVNGIEAFLPGSQIDVKPVRDYDIYVGQTMEFKVVKINHEFRNVVISHKILIEHDIENQRIDIMSKLEKGQILEGVVKNITSFGAFIDLGCNIDGLLHVYDLHWGRVTNIEDIVKLDDKINVVVLDFDDDKKRISLGLKQLYPHPWDSLDPEIKVGSRVKGKIVTIADYGAFIEIEPACEALLHITEATWSQHVRDPREILKIGDIVEAVVLTIDREARKMSVGMKQLLEDPWANAAEEFAIGSRHKAIVRNMNKFVKFE
ncbi:MAG: S1 RNA-binding domain-containing protein [Solitalea-like symbiont of Acarus siro]